MSNTCDSLIHRISQSHLNPGMNLTKLNQLFAQYGIQKVEGWDKLSIEQLKEMAQQVVAPQV